MPDTFSCKKKKKRRDDATHYFLHRSIGNMARNMERGRIQTSAIASMYPQDTETWHRKAGGLSPQQPALSPVDQVCNCQRWLQTVRTHRQGLLAGLGVNAKFWAHLWQTFDEGREKYIRTFCFKMQREEKKIQWASLSLFKTAVMFLHRRQTTFRSQPICRVNIFLIE